MIRRHKIIQWASILVAVLTVSLHEPATSAGPGNQHPLLAGASKVRITPSSRLYLAGFKQDRRSVGVHDDLFARSITLKKGGNRLTIISLDLIGLLNDDALEIIGQVKGVVGENVIITSTHTHSGPDTIGLWGPTLFGIKYIRSGVDKNFMTFLKGEVVRAILLASSRMVEAEIIFARAEISGISRNTRKVESLDRELTVMGIRGIEDKKPIATLINYACHPEALWHDNLLVTADFPGYLSETMERKWGGISLYINGALGGMVTVDVEVDEKGRGIRNFEVAERVGTALATRVLKSLSEAERASVPWIRIRKKEVAIPLSNFRFRLAKWLGIFDRPLVANRVSTEVWYVDLGDAQIITVPGEILPGLGLELKERMKGKYRFLFGLANDELGYILSKEDFHDPLYSYERTMSVGPEAGPIIYEGLLELLSP